MEFAQARIAASRRRRVGGALVALLSSGSPAVWRCVLCAALGFAAGRSIDDGTWVTGAWAVVLLAGCLGALAYRLADRSRLWEIPAVLLVGAFPFLLGLGVV